MSDKKQAVRSVILRTNQLAGWDDFRTADWAEIIEHPELTLQQTQQLLAITA